MIHKRINDYDFHSILSVFLMKYFIHIFQNICSSVFINNYFKQLGYEAFEWSKRLLDESGVELKYELTESTPVGKWTIKSYINNKVRNFLYIFTLKYAEATKITF